MKKKIRFIINPISGIGRQKLAERLIREHLDPSQFDVSIAYTASRGHATVLAKKAVEEGIEIVAAVGGDGSVNETGKALIGTPTALAILPAGSGNGFARHVQIPMDLVKALKMLNHHTLVKADTWQLNGETFLNVAGIGFDAHITQAFAVYGKRGFSSYAKIIFREFRKYRAQPCTLIIDGRKIETEAFMISIANGSQYGNNAYVQRSADLADGIAEVCVLGPFPLYAAPAIAYKLFRGSLSDSAYAKAYRGKEITVIHPGNCAHLDGDPIPVGNEIKITCQPASLTIVVPKKESAA